MFVGQSVRGASHVRSNTPNQDALLPQSTQAPFSITHLVISDGHGSAMNFRSDRGSDFGVKAADQQIQAFIAKTREYKNSREVERELRPGLAAPIVARWKQLVHEDLARDPFRDGELNTLEAKKGSGAIKQVQTEPTLAYGATLLIALVTSQALALLQLGDGDIVLISKEGSFHQPIHDERLLANETFSLCSDDAESLFLVKALPTSELPALVLLSSDGYSNSFQDRDGFCQAATDFYAIGREYGLDYIQQNLGHWLEETSTKGSGDDITVGMLCRSDILRLDGKRAQTTDQTLMTSQKKQSADDHALLQELLIRPPSVLLLSSTVIVLVMVLLILIFRGARP
jgi:hypothetical protein